jgi:N-carbamoylputrescine amidase
VKITAAAIQMPSEPMRVASNRDRADDLLRQAYQSGAELIVLPEMYNTGYCKLPDYAPIAEDREGATLQLLRERSRAWDVSIAAGFVERDCHHLYDSLAYCTPEGSIHIYRKRRLVFWEWFSFSPGREPLVVSTRWGRIGFAICADMIYHDVWSGYRDRIDLAIIAAAWPEFTNRISGRKHWLLGHIGAMAGEIPRKVSVDLGIPVVFANQCGETKTTIPLLGARFADRFCGMSSICDGLNGRLVQADKDERIVLGEMIVHSPKGPKSCRSTFVSAPAASSFIAERCLSDGSDRGSTVERTVAAR